MGTSKRDKTKLILLQLQDSYILATSDKVHLDKAMEAMDYAKAELNQMHGH